MLTEEDKLNIEKQRFILRIQSDIASLDFQRDRILQGATIKYGDGVKPTHDADFYMILLRRLYRLIEDVKYDSRVANLKGKFSGLCKKIKIRDHFEHKIDFNNFSQCAPGIFIVSSLIINGDQSCVVSGDKEWFLVEDHYQFKQLLDSFIKLYPFTTNP